MLWALFPILAGAAQSCPVLRDHQFTSGLQNGQPQDNIIFMPANLQELYLLTRTEASSEDTLVFEWGQSQERVRVGVTITPEQTPVWSSRQLSAQQNRIRVALSTASGCALGDWTLHRITPTYPVLVPAPASALPVPLPAELHHLLHQGDITGFRLEARARADSLTLGQQGIVARIEATTIPLMQLEKDIDEDRLYIASGRVTQLLQHPDLDSWQSLRLQKSTRRLAQRMRHLNHQIRHQLNTLTTVLAGSATGLTPCPESAQDASSLWEKLNPGLPLHLTGRDETNPQRLHVMDTRTGEIHSIDSSCLVLFDQLPPKNR